MPLKSGFITMLTLDKQVSIIMHNNFNCKKKYIIKVNSDIVTFVVCLPCMMLGKRRKEIVFFLCFHSGEEKKKRSLYWAVGRRADK